MIPRPPYSNLRTPYEEGIAIFIDLLGFGAAVRERSGPESWVLADLLASLKSRNTDAREVETSIWNIGYWGRRYFAASDSIFISSKAVFEPIDVNNQAVLPPDMDYDRISVVKYIRPLLPFIPFASALRECAMIQATLLSQGFLSRGGIKIGPLRQQGGILIGPAFDKAVAFEKSVSKDFPTVKFLADDIGPLRSAFYKWLHSPESKHPSCPLPFIGRKDARSHLDARTAASFERWKNCVKEPFSCVFKVTREIYSLDFIQLADSERLWHSTQREDACRHVLRSVEDLRRKPAWRFNKNQRHSVKKWEWTKHRLEI